MFELLIVFVCLLPVVVWWLWHLALKPTVEPAAQPLPGFISLPEVPITYRVVGIHPFFEDCCFLTDDAQLAQNHADWLDQHGYTGISISHGQYTGISIARG